MRKVNSSTWAGAPENAKNAEKTNGDQPTDQLVHATKDCQGTTLADNQLGERKQDTDIMTDPMDTHSTIAHSARVHVQKHTCKNSCKDRHSP